MPDRRRAAKQVVAAAIGLVSLLSGCPSPGGRGAATPTVAPGRATPAATRPADAGLPTTPPTSRQAGTPTPGTTGGRAAGPAIDPRLTNRATVPVTRVVDGDTVNVRLEGQNRPVRIIGLNTPEVPGPYREAQCFGQEASDRAKSLLTDQTITIAQDPTQDSQDQFQRTLAYVWLPDGRLYEEEMIREGYAKEYTYNRQQPYLLQERLRAAERQARQAGRGLWAAGTCNGNINQPPRGG